MAGARGTTIVRVVGGRELRRRLRTVEGGLDDLRDAHRWVAAYVGALARAGAPVRTGRLAATERDSGTRTTSVVRFGRATAPYAGPIHYGWPARHIAAQPWVVTAAQASESVWTAYYESAVADLVERTPA
ncbi:hypothetical protein ACIRQY_29105 [Streptomyces sp. NPDC101490]|uniref:hypothetical protein n=1 Tax=Streptomyces sp. NPDC101490 TaxID=3366143 RepID=UPI0037FDCCBD